MTDLYDELFNSNRFARDKWNETEPDFDALPYEDDEDEQSSDEDELTLDEWLATN